MQIFDSDKKSILEVEVDDTSYRYRAIMGDHNLTLKFALAEHVEIPVGAWTEYQNEIYTLMRPEALTMKHTHNFEYTVTMESAQALATMWKFRNTVDGRLKFSYTAKPIEHLQMFIDNMNEREGSEEWTIGECIENVEVCINYDHAYCYEALGQIADTFETEFEIKGKTVSLKKLEYNKDNPLSLSYGKGKGFQPSIGRSNYGDTPPVEILFAQGGTDNIDASQYGCSELLLPKKQEIGYDGEHFSDEEGWEEGNVNNRWYKVDDDGLSIRRADKELESKAEDSLDCSDIYPKRVGEVTGVVHDETNDWWDIIDTTIPDELDYEDCLIAGETMTIIFQSGQLAGKEFEVNYHHTADSSGEGKRFEIVPQEIDGYTMPCTTGGYCPQLHDTYAVFNCMLPKAYICDNNDKSGAEWDMFRKAVQYFYENEEQKFTFSGKLDGIWSKNDWENIGGRILLGGYIALGDLPFQEEPLLIRITGIKDYINKPHSPEIELSNGIISAGFSTSLRQMESQNVLIEDSYNDSLSFTKRRFRDAQETLTMLQALTDSLANEFTSAISPITVQTMSLLVGDESLQFRYVAAGSPQIIRPAYPLTPVSHDFVYDNDKKVLSTDEGYIQHMTLNISTISDEHNDDEYVVIYVPSYTSAILDNPDESYYFYVQFDSSSPANVKRGTYLLSSSPLNFDDGEYYNLLVGILNSEYDGERSFVALFGYTEILPGRITTDKIVSSDGDTYIDLVNSEISGKIVFKNGDGENVTTIDGGIVTAGTLQVGIADSSSSVAGLTAEDLSGSSSMTSPVRFWAGTNYDNRESAPFRVTQDGSMYSVQGEIGGFTIGSESLEATSARITFTASNDTMQLMSSALHFNRSYWNGENVDTDIWVGSQAVPSMVSLVCTERINIEGSCTSYGNAGIYINVSGAIASDGATNQYTGNHALYINKGDICGFRLRTRRVASDTELSLMDSIIIVTTDGVTITLPDNPEDGQMYFIRRLYEHTYYIKSNRNNIYQGHWSQVGTNSKTISNSFTCVLMYDAYSTDNEGNKGIWFVNKFETL